MTAETLGGGEGSSKAKGLCAKNAVALAELVREFHFLYHHINTAIEVVSPPMVSRLIELHDALVEKCPSYTALHANDIHCHLSMMGLLFNKVTGEHLDSAPPGFYDVLVGGGKHHEGGEMVLTDLGIKVPFKPGDLLVLAGSILKHHTLPWKGVARCTIVMFCQEPVLRKMGVDCVLDE